MSYSSYKTSSEQKELIVRPEPEEDEIDLVELAKTLWNGKRTIIIATVVFAVLGLAVALLTPKEFTATSTMIPQTSQGSSKLGGISSLASLAGFNINMSAGGEISPLIYPLIIQSSPFQLELMNTKYHFPDVEEPVSLFAYYTEIKKPSALTTVKKYTIGLPGVLRKSITSNEPEFSSSGEIPQLTREQNRIKELLTQNIILDFSDKDGYMTLSTTLHDPVVAAEVTEKAQGMLQKYITDLKVEKAAAKLEFIENRFTEKKKEFEYSLSTLAAFRDRNKNVTSALAQTEENQLENAYQLAFNVYSELAKQMEQARIQVKEDTPVFSIIQPVMVPLERSKPKRAMILFTWTFLGVVAGAGLVFGKKFLQDIKKKWNT